MGSTLIRFSFRLSKPIEQGKWSAGYTASLSYGPDAQAIDAGAYPIRQAYVDLGIPVGNGLEVKIGRFDQLLGYETSDSMNDPNWTRSYAYGFEPTEQTGLMASYKFADWIGLQGGVVDEVSTIGGVNARYESRRGVTGLLTLTAPDSWGWVKGSALYGGIDYGPGGANDLLEAYVGFTLNTPIKDLTVGASWDNISDTPIGTGSLAGTTTATGTVIPGQFDAGSFNSFCGYVSYKPTEKSTLSGRFEYANGSALSALEAVDNSSVATVAAPGGAGGTVTAPVAPFGALDKVIAVTGTFQYRPVG